MLKLIETAQNGKVTEWFADSKEDFCLKVLRANPRADIEPEATYEQIVEWLASSLRSLEIEECNQ